VLDAHVLGRAVAEASPHPSGVARLATRFPLCRAPFQADNLISDNAARPFGPYGLPSEWGPTVICVVVIVRTEFARRDRASHNYIVGRWKGHVKEYIQPARYYKSHNLALSGTRPNASTTC
jgi:hypothetical protein